MAASNIDITTAADPTDKKTGFFDLSAELRNEIYELAITEPDTNDFYAFKIPGICQVN